MYVKAGKSLNSATKSDERLEALAGLKTKLKERRPCYAEFEARFLELRHSTKFTKDKDLVRYILGAISRYKGNGVAIEMDEMTIEHLGSQNSKKPLLTDEQTASIGNLLFVTKDLNAKLKNKSFTEKRAILVSSNMWIDDVIKGAADWGPEEVENRGKVLSELAYEKIWKL